MALRKPIVREGDLYTPAPTGGWNPDAHPWELPANQAAVMDNLLVRPGKVVMRGSIRQFANWASPLTKVVPAGWVSGLTSSAPSVPWLLVGRLTTVGIDAADAAWAHQPAAGRSVANTVAAFATTPTGTNFVSTTVTRDTAPGPRWVDHDGLLYGIGLDGSGTALTDAQASYTISPTAMLTLGYLQSTGAAPTLQALAPHGAIDITSYQSRIWLLGGVDTPAGAGVATHNANALFYTIPGAAGVGTATADWRDPTFGTTNLTVIDRDTSDPAVGLARGRNILIIFRRNSIAVLRGTTTANYTTQRISSEVGCIDQRTIVETDAGVYFMSHRGLMLTDGTSVRNVSGPLFQQLRLAIANTRAYPNQFGYASMCLLSDGSLVMSFGNRTAGGFFQPVFCAVLDRNTGTWWRLTSNTWGHATPSIYPGPVFSFRTPPYAYAVSDTTVALLEGAFTNNSIVMPELQTLYDDNNLTTAWKAIPAVWTTRQLPTISPEERRSVMLRRLYVDYVFGVAGGFGPGGWTVTATDPSGNTLFTQTVPFVTNVSTSNGGPVIPFIPQAGARVLPSIQRKDVDQIQETTDISLTFSFVDPTTQASNVTAAAAEIYGIGIGLLPAATEPEV